MKNQMELMPEEFQESMTEDALPPHESAVLFSPPLPEVGRRVSRGDENRKAPKRFSRDEMNLAEFPLSVLSTRVRPGVKTLEFEDTVYDKNGKPIQREWIITAADKFGLPTASDDEVLLGLLKISVEKGLDERKVFFTRYELLRTLRWSTEGRSYKRLTNALDRLSGVRIKASNSFYDNDSKAFNTRNFGIIDEYEINSGKMQNPKPSFFVWSEVLHKSFRSGFIKKLDFDFFLSLESAVSKRLYRFLDKHFWYRATFSMNLFTLAHEKIGVSRTYRYPSSLRQQIDPAVEELIQRGFLSNVEYTGQGKGTEITFYAAGENGRRSERRGSSSRTAASVSTSRDGRAREEARKTRDLAAKSSVSSEKGSPVTGSSVRGDYDVCEGLEEKLLARGISEPQASRLATLLSGERDSARAEEVVRFFDDLVQKKSHLISRNAPGFLYRALEDPWKFVLPTDSEQQVEPSRSELKTKARQRSVQKSNPKRRSGGGDAESRYLTFRKREIGRLTGQLEPSLQQGLEQEVRTALENIRSLVSEAGFAEAVKHGVEEKVAKLFAVPTYEEWLRSGGE